MSLIKQKFINISVSRITNWPSSLSLANFEISFYSQKNDALIITKFIKGLYTINTKSVELNSLMRIKYVQDEKEVILKLTYRIGIPGQIMLGRFKINLQNLHLNQQLQFPIDKRKNQLLIVEVCTETRRKQIINRQENLFKKHLRIENIRSSRNKDFIRERQEFLQKYSNRSRNSSRQSKEYNFLSNKLNGLPFQQQKSKKQHKTQCQKQLKRSQNASLNSSSRHSNRSNTKSSKALIRFRTEKSQNHSERSNQSSGKYILLLKNLNVIPREQYYQTQNIKVLPSRREDRNEQKLNHLGKNIFNFLSIKKDKIQIAKNQNHQSKISSQYF